MRIAVIGTGKIGGTLGAKWLAAGHDVVYGSRSAGGSGGSSPVASAAGDGGGSPSAAGSASGAGPGGAPLLAIGDAVDGADVVALAVPGKSAPDVIGAIGPALAGKVVIDAANRIGESESNSKAAVRAAAPQASYVRAFNTLGWENFADPLPSAALFFAADPAARHLAEELIAAVGLEPVCVGDADAAGTVDSLLPLWFALVQQQGGNRRLALRVVR